jgi:3-oxoadipate enol-lactonase
MTTTHSNTQAPRLHVLRQGSGQPGRPVVVLSHALGCELGMWDGVAAALEAAQYAVLRYDHRGHGRSEVVPGPYSIEALADDAAALIRREVDQPVHFVGLSMGGMTAQALAARYPDIVKSIVVANAADYYDEPARAMWQARVDLVRKQGVAVIADGAMQRWFTPEFRADQPPGSAAKVALLRARLEAMEPQAYADSCLAVRGIDFRKSNPRIACPALVIAGSRDEATPLALSEAIQAGIQGAQLAQIDAAHLSAVEQPQAFAQLLQDFFDSVR